jgi:hypothetical protein
MTHTTKFIVCPFLYNHGIDQKETFRIWIVHPRKPQIKKLKGISSFQYIVQMPKIKMKKGTKGE